MNRFTKLWLALCILICAAVCFGFSFVITQPECNNLLVGLAGNLFAVALGIVIVNQYLESSSRKRAVKALLTLSDQVIAEFHNHWMNICWAEFGRDKYGEIAAEYIRSNGKPEAIKEEVRHQIYAIYKDDLVLQNYVRKLDEVLAEVSRLAGWSLDPSFLAECLRGRIAISRLFSTILDGSILAVNSVTEQILDIDLLANASRQMLIQMAGIKTEDG